jgi:integrase
MLESLTRPVVRRRGSRVVLIAEVRLIPGDDERSLERAGCMPENLLTLSRAFLRIWRSSSFSIRAVSGAVWGEFDLDKALWTIPKERMKAGVEHRVPLPVRAVEILRERKAVASGSLVFEGEREGRPISDTAMVKAPKAAAPQKATTLHRFSVEFQR